MAEPWSRYQRVIIETYSAVKPGKSSRVHARPVPGQAYSTNWDVESSRPMRKRHPTGAKSPIFAKETNREGGKPFLHTHYSWPYEVVV